MMDGRWRPVSAELIFKLKRQVFTRHLTNRRTQRERERERPYAHIGVRRDHVFQDSFTQLTSMDAADVCDRLHISFVGEDGIDGGGVTRDWYSALSREIFNPQYGLFISSAADDYTFQLNPNSEIIPDHLDIFRFIGTIVGKTLVDGCLMEGHFSRLVYKRMLNKSLTVHDMATVDAELYKSLLWLLGNDLEGMDLGLTFSVEREIFGAHEEIELKSEGKEMSVCEANKQEYVELLCEWYLEKRTESQFKAFMEGLARVVEPESLQLFDEKELEWLFGGIPFINVGDWRRSTVYRSGYHDCVTYPVIRWFWQLVESWSQEMRARLLQFVTGTSKVPYPDGFYGLRGCSGLTRFCIVRVSDTGRLPQARTCFNELLLPHYGSYEELESKLKTALMDSGNQFQLH